MNLQNDLMFYSVDQGQTRFLKFIVRNFKVDLNALDPKGRSVLHLAVQKGDIEIASFLADENVSKGSLCSRYLGSTGLRDNRYQTPLHIAAKYGHLEILQMLLNKGFIFNGYYDCLNALRTAVINKHPKVVKLLLDEYINIGYDNPTLVLFFCTAPLIFLTSIYIISDPKNPSIENALGLGSVVFNIFLMNSLSKHSMVKGKMHLIQDISFICIYTLIFGIESILNDLPDIAKFLAHYTLILYAAFSNYILMSIAEGEWIKLLNYSISLGYYDIVEIFLDHQINISQIDSNNTCPIYLAKMCGDIKALSIFFKKGVALPMSCKKLLIHNAIQENKTTVLSDLISDIYWYKYSIYYAAKIDQSEVLKFLLSCDYSLNDLGAVLYCAVYHGCLEAAKVLISVGVSTEFRDNQGRTSLYLASEKGLIEIVKLLLDNGAEFNSSPYSFQILFISIFKSHNKVAKELIRQNVDIQNKDGNTALHCAVAYEKIEILDFLLDKGVCLNTKNNLGYSPLDLSFYSSNLIISLKLIAAGAQISSSSLNKILDNLDDFYLNFTKLHPLEFGGAFFNILATIFKADHKTFEDDNDRYFIVIPDACNNLIDNLISELLSINHQQSSYSKQKAWKFNKVSKVLDAITNFNNISDVDRICKVISDELEALARDAKNYLDPLAHLCIKNQSKQQSHLSAKIEDIFLKGYVISCLHVTEQIQLTEISKSFLDDLFIVNTETIGVNIIVN